MKRALVRPSHNMRAAKKHYLFFLLLACISLASNAGNIASSIIYKTPLSDSQKKQFQRAMEETWQLLPPKIIQELPDDLEIVIDDINGRKIKKDRLETDDIDCGTQDKLFGLHFGKYNRFNKKITIDYRIALKLASNDSTPLGCRHKTMYRLAQATILHEAVHAWDAQVARHRAQDFLRLSGWDKSWFGYKQKNTQPHRSADIYEFTSPKESLSVNMEYFLLDSDYRCRRPSLYYYFVNTLNYQPEFLITSEQLQPCNDEVITNYAEFLVLKKIDASRVYRVDYLLAAAGDDLVSNYGHSMFRIVMCAPEHYSSAIKATVPATPIGPECLKDEAFHLVVSFRANVDDVVLNYWKGLVGGYISRPYILPYLQVREEYTADELRDIALYPLQLPDKDRDVWLAHIVELSWTYGGDYKFLTNNCAVESLSTLQSAFPRHAVTQYSPLSPLGVLNALKDSGLIDSDLHDVTVIKSKEAEFDALYLIAFPSGAVNGSKDYLMHTSAIQRAELFPKNENKNVQRVAALRRLEEQIKRVETRRLIMLARQSLYESMRENVKGFFSPELSKALTLRGYGIPYSDEIDFDEEAQLEQIKDIRQKILAWVMQYQIVRWQELSDIDHNLEVLDILAARELEKQGFQ